MSSQERSVPFEHFPVEVLILIAVHLDIGSIGRCARAHRRLGNLLRTDARVWHMLLQRDFGHGGPLGGVLGANVNHVEHPYKEDVEDQIDCGGAARVSAIRAALGVGDSLQRKFANLELRFALGLSVNLTFGDSTVRSKMAVGSAIEVPIGRGFAVSARNQEPRVAGHRQTGHSPNRAKCVERLCYQSYVSVLRVWQNYDPELPPRSWLVIGLEDSLRDDMINALVRLRTREPAEQARLLCPEDNSNDGSCSSARVVRFRSGKSAVLGMRTCRGWFQGGKDTTFRGRFGRKPPGLFFVVDGQRMSLDETYAQLVYSEFHGTLGEAKDYRTLSAVLIVANVHRGPVAPVFQWYPHLRYSEYRNARSARKLEQRLVKERRRASVFDACSSPFSAFPLPGEHSGSSGSGSGSDSDDGESGASGDSGTYDDEVSRAPLPTRESTLAWVLHFLGIYALDRGPIQMCPYYAGPVTIAAVCSDDIFSSSDEHSRCTLSELADWCVGTSWHPHWRVPEASLLCRLSARGAVLGDIDYHRGSTGAFEHWSAFD